MNKTKRFEKIYATKLEEITQKNIEVQEENLELQNQIKQKQEAHLKLHEEYDKAVQLMIMGYNNVIGSSKNVQQTALQSNEEAANKQIGLELEQLRSNIDDNIEINAEEDITFWEVSVRSPQRTYNFEIEFPIDYPLNPPCIRFVTKI